MTVSVPSMVRLLLLLGVGSTILAVGVSRLDPPHPIRRSLLPVTSVNINDCYLKVADRLPRWLDTRSGKLSVCPVQADDILEEASCSPWVDEAGKRQVVGRWSSRTWSGTRTVSHAFGLGRYSFPDGKPLNQVACDVVPVGPPCWFPGTRAGVLFAAGDGQLYRFDFEPSGPTDSGRADPAGPTDRQPTPLSWRCPKPGVGEVFLGEVSRPADPRLGGRLVAALRLQHRDQAGNSQFSASQLWWLEIDPAGREIVDAGPLLHDDQTGDPIRSCDERSPVVASLPDGSLALAYNRQIQADAGWSVCLVALPRSVDGRPVPALESQSLSYPMQTQPAPMAFSPDGRWLNVLVGSTPNDRSVARIATTPVLLTQNHPAHPPMRPER